MKFYAVPLSDSLLSNLCPGELQISNSFQYKEVSYEKEFKNWQKILEKLDYSNCNK